MRKFDLEKPFSKADIEWLRQAGSIMTEDQIQRHQDQFEQDIPDPETPEDKFTRSTLDPNARTADYVPGSGAPKLVDPSQPEDEEYVEGEGDEEGDDYDRWPVKELEAEVKSRNKISNESDGAVSAVEVHGTGKDGKILKQDLIKGLRLWDVENPVTTEVPQD